MRIAIDMDEVLADTLTAQLEWFRREHGYSLTHSELAGKHVSMIVDEEHALRHERYAQEGPFFGDLPVMSGALDAIAELNELHEIFVTTAAMEYPRSFTYKFDWMRRHFPFIPAGRIVFCGDKSIINADVMVDDNARHFERFRGQGVLFSAPHNLHVTGWPRVHTWAEARDLLLSGQVLASA